MEIYSANRKSKQETELFVKELTQMKDILDHYFSDVVKIITKDNDKLKENMLLSSIGGLQGNELPEIVPEDLKAQYGPTRFEIVKNISKILDSLKSMSNKQMYTDFLNNYFKLLDFPMYLKIFEKINEIEGFKVAMLVYCPTLSFGEYEEVFQKARNVRNSTIHSSDFHMEDFQKPEAMFEAVKWYSKSYTLTKNTRLASIYEERINIHKARCINIIKSEPLTLSQVERILPQLTKEQLLIELTGRFETAYDANNKILYGWTEAELCNMYKHFAKNVGENKQIKNEQTVAKISKEDMPYLEAYSEKAGETAGKVFLEKAEWKEIAKNCTVILDTSVFLPKLHTNIKHRDYVRHEIIPLLKENGTVPFVDYSSRVELNIISEQADDANASEARLARSQIHSLNENGSLMFIKKSGVLYTKGCYGITNVVNSNPKTRFVVISQDAESQKHIINHTSNNCLVVCISTIGQIGAYVLANNKDKIRSFATGLRKETKEEKVAQPSINPPKAVLPNGSTTVTNLFGNNVKDAFIVSNTLGTTESKQVAISDKQSESTKQIKKEVKSQNAPEQALNKPQQALANPTGIIKETKEMLPNSLKISTGSHLKDSKGNDYVLGDVIGEGGEGTAYEIDQDYVAKVYHPSSLTKNRYDKLKLMAGNNPGINKLCYPIKTLCNENNEFVGYLMPKAPDYYVALGKGIMKLGSNDVKALVQKNPKLAGLEKWNRYHLTRLCANIAKTFAEMHDKGILMGDINQNNILVNCRNAEGGEFKIIDCDSFQIGPYPCPVGTDEFTSPKIYKREHTERPEYGTFLRKTEDDEYALASLLFRILMFGQQPYASKGSKEITEAEARRNYNFSFKFADEKGKEAPEGVYSLIWSNLNYRIKELFVSVFSEGKEVSAKTWYYELNKYAEQIKSGKYSSELQPYRYYDPTGEKTVDITCAICHRKANMYKDYYKKVVENHAIPLCALCQAATVPLLRRNIVKVKCENCGKEYETNAYVAASHDYGDRRFRNFICPECKETIQISCASCGKSISIRKYRYKDGIKYYCAECNEKVETHCATCGKLIEVPKYKTIKYKRLYCDMHMPKARN